MYVRLNLATKPLVSQRRFLVAASAVGIVAGLLFLFLGARLYSLRKSDAEYRAQLNGIQQQMNRLQEQRNDLERFYTEPVNRDLQERARFVDQLIIARSFNWTRMFMDLEHTLPPGVHVISIDPKLENGTVSVKFVVGAASQEAKVSLLKAFEESKSFTHVELHAAELPRQGASATGDSMAVEFSAIYTGI